MLKITLHGAAKEVGRSCVELSDSAGKMVLLDSGLKFAVNMTEYPAGVADVGKIDLIIISHAHLDHTGALPVFYHNGFRGNIAMTRMTKAMSKILLKDNWKIEMLNHNKALYNKEEIFEMLDTISITELGEEKELRGVKFRFADAGHIPGSASVLLRLGGKNIIYTGDIKATETRLMKRSAIAELSQELKSRNESLDILITEATYGNREHANRKEEENKFLNMVEESIAEGKSALIPTFAVGRAQEMLLLLSQRKFEAPVYLDGMARDVSELCLENPSSIRDAKALRQAIAKVNFVKGNIQRKSICRKQGIFLTTSGMMDGGPVIDYLRYINSKNTDILLTGFQVETSNGYAIMHKKLIKIDGKMTAIECDIHQFDFSAHSGASELRDMIAKLNPKAVIINHADPEETEDLLGWLNSSNIKAYAPELNQTIEFI